VTTSKGYFMPVITHQLASEDVSILRGLTAAAAEAEGLTVEQRLRTMALLAHAAPARLRRAMVEFRMLEPAGAMIVSGLPVEESALGPTPGHWRHAAMEWSDEDLLLLLLGSLLGDPFAWSTQQDGRFVHNILPIKDHADEQLGSGTSQVLWWHTEDAFHEARPDYLLLFCLRNPNDVATTYADVSSLDLEPELFALLSEPEFLIRPDNSHKPEHNSAPLDSNAEAVSSAFDSIGRRQADPRRIPVLFGDPRSPYARLDPYFMEDPLSVSHAEAFASLCARINESLEHIVLRPGDCLVLDNYRAVHGRDAYEARFDGTDRWLKRVNVTRDLRSSRALRGGADSATIFG
jgi:Fe(II)/alpha-ketoglutarate-dependent arginine beta-hydroxylase